MIKFSPNINIKEIKQNYVYIFGEICLFSFNIFKLVTQNNVSLILLIVLFVVIVIHIFSYIKNRKNKNNIPDELKFMVDFANVIGYTKQKSINKFSDSNCIIDSIKKIYEIDGINVKMQKEYIGRVSTNASDGIKIMTCGGSSISSNNIDAYTYCFDFLTNKYKHTRYKLEYEDERSKLLKIYFNNTLGKDEQFKIKYVEKQWEGAMRINYDGILIGEQLFFKELKEQNIILKFNNVNNLKCEIFQYNFKTNEISKLNIKTSISNYECNCSIKNNDIEKNCILFLMYRYD